MRYSTTITIGVMSLIVAACGPGVAEPTPVPVVLNAEVCTEGEARDIRVYVRNLEDFEPTFPRSAAWERRNPVRVLPI